MNKSVVAIVVTYNRRQLLRECVDCLLAQTYADMDILVVDNASTDGTGDDMMPLGEAGRLFYVNTGSNLGGAGGFHFGLRAAVCMGYEYAWVMDDDSMPTPTALSELMEAAKAVGSFGYLSGKVLWTDGSVCRMNVQRDLRMRNITDYSAERVPSGAATFVSLLLPMRVVREVGLPIGDFFIWADDLEYTRRISRRYPCYVIPASVTVHKCATNNGGNIATDEEERIERYRYAYRNEVYVYRREGFRGFARLMARTPVHILRVLVKSHGQRRRRIRVILGGTLRGLAFNPPIEYVEQPRGSAPRPGE